MNAFQECSRCIMNSSVDREITFNNAGLCNHCVRYDALLSSRVFSGEIAEVKLKALVDKIKQAGKGKDYDCIVGVSGGVDSTYVAYLCKTLGLRPLAVHFDNGWDSELAVKNIEQVLSKLDIDLFTYVVDWDEFRELQLSFLKGSTPDGEVPTDHAIGALLWQQAAKHGVKYIISGMNFVTESISVPSWAYGHSDWRYIRAVHRKFSKLRLRSYPHFSFLYLFYVNWIRGVRIVSILNYVDYQKEDVKKVLQSELGWVDYGGKHHESIYTRFYQGYILPTKFNIDKRYAHLSDLINAGQVSRESALHELEEEPYPKALQQQDLEYACKKLGLTPSEFDELMSKKIQSFRDYPNSYDFVQFLRNTVNKLRELGWYPK